MDNYLQIPDLSLHYLPIQDLALKHPNKNGYRLKWKDVDYGSPSDWSDDICNYGIKISNGLMVIDIDNKSIDGEKPSSNEIITSAYSLPRLTTLRTLLPQLTDAYTEITASGGFHIYTRCTALNKREIDLGGQKIDLLGSDFVVCANTDTNVLDTKWSPGEYSI